MKRYVHYETIIKKLLDEVKILKEEKKNCQNQEERRILDEESTKRMEDENQQTTLQKTIIRDQQRLQIGEASTKIQGLRHKKN
jgi:hypothetical protein